MSEKRKITLKKLVIIVSAACAFFACVWLAVNSGRLMRDALISDIQNELIEYRHGARKGLSFSISDSYMEDPVFKEFILAQAQEMCQNNELKLLICYLGKLPCQDASIVEAVVNYFNSGNDIERAETIKSELKKGLKNTDYDDLYEKCTFNRNSGVVASYIRKHGTKSFTTTHGTGYYGSKDEKTKETVGIKGSPLYDAKREYSMGDFLYIRRWGVKLNSTYHETDYLNESYRFRGVDLDFSPEDGQCVWFGNYLFCFSSDGSVVGYEKIG